jgi:transcription initiation factor TFIID subunit 7
MLVVEDTVLPSEEALQATKKAFNANEFVWPHGLTPPLQHVRRRRFRKRLNRQAIEIVENEVDRLLAEEKGGTNVEESQYVYLSQYPY